MQLLFFLDFSVSLSVRISRGIIFLLESFVPYVIRYIMIRFAKRCFEALDRDVLSISRPQLCVFVQDRNRRMILDGIRIFIFLIDASRTLGRMSPFYKTRPKNGFFSGLPWPYRRFDPRFCRRHRNALRWILDPIARSLFDLIRASFSSLASAKRALRDDSVALSLWGPIKFGQRTGDKLSCQEFDRFTFEQWMFGTFARSCQSSIVIVDRLTIG